MGLFEEDEDRIFVGAIKMNKAKMGNGRGNYAILRTNKISTTANLSSALGHNSRESDVENADKNGQIHLEGTKEKALNKFNNIVDNLDKPMRKNAVKAIEYVIAYSPDAKIDHNKYFDNAADFFIKKHGIENIIQLAVHYDEKTPHMHLIAVPVVKKKYKDGTKKTALCCRDFLGGRDKMVKLQDNFYKKCGRKFGLERGEKGSKAKHIDIKTYYGAVEKYGSLKKVLDEQQTELDEKMRNIKNAQTRLEFDMKKNEMTVLDRVRLSQYDKASGRTKSKDKGFSR